MTTKYKSRFDTEKLRSLSDKMYYWDNQVIYYDEKLKDNRRQFDLAFKGYGTKLSNEAMKDLNNKFDNLKNQRQLCLINSDNIFKDIQRIETSEMKKESTTGCIVTGYSSKTTTVEPENDFFSNLFGGNENKNTKPKKPTSFLDYLF